MNKNIFIHEFRARLKSVLIWGFGLTVLIGFFFSLFPVFADQANLMNEFLSRYPPQFRAAFGFDKMDVSTVLGFYSLIFMFVQLCLAIQASNYGFGLVSIEESELTADFLLSKPVSRSEVMTSKLLAALAALTLTNAWIWACTLVAVALFSEGKEYRFSTLILLLASIVIFQLFFLGVGLVLSLLVRRVRSVTPYALGLGFGAYVLSAFSGVLGDIALEYITPFKHLDAAAIVRDGAYNIPLVLLNVAVTVMALAASSWLYLRRDIPAVSEAGRTMWAAIRWLRPSDGSAHPVGPQL
ncbi:MAG TPA: ABC transporter permease subunit [Anaerolineales bacterium]